MPRASTRLVLSCEHASAAVPRDLAWLFRNDRAVLATHRGFDAGALAVARGLARRLAVPLVAGTTTRLLVDLNRSPHNSAIFSPWTRALPRAEREALVDRLHAPHWERAARMVDQTGGPVVHFAIHSFTPTLRDEVRDFELGLLYDPGRPRERALADALREAIARRAPHLRIRRNAPYRGRSDGLPTAFRKQRKPADYLGLEIELNQACLRSASDPRAWAELLAPCLAEVLASTDSRRAPHSRARRTRRASAKG